MIQCQSGKDQCKRCGLRSGRGAEYSVNIRKQYDWRMELRSACASGVIVCHSIRPRPFPFTVLTLAIWLVVTASAQQIPSDGSASDTNAAYFQAQPQTSPYFVRAGEPGPTLTCAASPKYAQDSQYRLIWVKVIQSGSPRIISQGSDNYSPGQYNLDAGNTCHGCYNLRLRNVSFAEDNGRFYCQLIGPNGFVMDSNVAQVVVLVRPGPPQITGQSAGPSREVQPAQLQCQSSGGNPPPKITWKFGNNTDVSGMASIRNATDLSSATISTLSWLISYRENNQYLRCFVWNEAMGESTAPMEALSARFSVQYAPKVTVGPSNPYLVEDQTEATFHCSADANPPVRSYAWSYSTPDPSSSSNAPVSNSQNWTLHISHQQRGVYTCTATNELGSGQGMLQVDVQYGPKINFSTAIGNQSSSFVLLNENQPLSVTCQPDSNPPVTSVSWTGPTGQTLSDNAVLNLASISRKDAGNYTCTSKNTLTPFGGGSVQREGSGVLQVKVKHAPGKAVISESEAAVVGGSVSLYCTTDDEGAPAAQYHWKAPGQQDYEMVARAVYTIHNVQMDKAGEYSCEPYNEIGKGQASSHRLVIYQPAQLDEHLKQEDQKREGESYELTCAARGHPSPNVTWYKDDEPVPVTSDHWTISTRTDSSNGDCVDPSNDQCSSKVVSVLKWLDGIKWHDKGSVSCRAYNGAGKATESKTLLRVQHKPVIINDPTRPYVAAELGQQVTIACKASANPEPLFRWTRGGQQGDLVASDSSAAESGGKQQYSMNQAKINQSYDLYEQTLLIRQVDDDDFGQYQCKANNQLGESSFVFKLQRKSKPISPEEFQSTSDRTHRSLELSWVLGFNGGYDQTFTIEQVESGLTYNVTEGVAASAVQPVRQASIEKPIRAKYNISNLAPASTYSFRIKAWNRLGETEWSDKISAMTADAPLDKDIKKPEQAVYQSDTNVLEVKPTLDSSKYCLLIYLHQPSGIWETWNCVDPDSSIREVPPASAIRIRFCNLYTMYCGESIELIINVGTAFPAPIVVAICVAIGVLLALAGVIYCCCRRTRRQKLGAAAARKEFVSGDKKNDLKKHKKTASISNAVSNNGTGKKDYEMEINQARPKAISGPYLTKNTPGPIMGLVTDQHTGSSKDSGVFTASSALNNYPYGSSVSVNVNRNAYVPGPSAQMGYNGTTIGHRHQHGQTAMSNVNESGVLNGPPSYDGHEHWGATDGYGLANAGTVYLDEHHQHRHAHDGRNGHQANGTYYDAHAPPPLDPYGAVGFVDMNPNGTTVADESVNSGYSTPTQRRVMREIIV